MVENDGIAAALSRLVDDDLVRLRAAADSSPNVVPGLLAYLDYAGDWEQHRRRGVDLEMLGPMAAVEDSEVEAALAALRVLSARFSSSGHDAVASLFDAVADAIRRAAPRGPRRSLH
jgi:hypothetical protein